MSRPLTCDHCNQVIDTPIAPIKVAVNTLADDSLASSSYDELGMAMQIAKQLGAVAPVEQELLDFCSAVCLAVWAWSRAGVQFTVASS